jgi:hypothetical protein
VRQPWCLLPAHPVDQRPPAKGTASDREQREHARSTVNSVNMGGPLPYWRNQVRGRATDEVGLLTATRICRGTARQKRAHNKYRSSDIANRQIASAETVNDSYSTHIDPARVPDADLKASITLYNNWRDSNRPGSRLGQPGRPTGRQIDVVPT